MSRTRNSQVKGPRNRYFHRAKMSEYQFKKLLWLFACDHSPTQAAQQLSLSLNTINAIYIKIRTYFVALGIFRDFYEVPEGIEISDDDEWRFLDFHLKRVARMKGLKPLKQAEIDLHLYESNWRHGYLVFADGQRDHHVNLMIYDDLISVIKLCGAINTTPQNHKAAHRLMNERLDQRLLWLERNSPLLKDSIHRKQLRAIKDINPES